MITLITNVHSLLSQRQYFSIFILIIVSLTACKTVPSKTPNLAFAKETQNLGIVKKWKTPVTPHQGSIKLNFKLINKNTTDVNLYKDSSSDFPNPLVQIRFSDENCSTGFKMKITYQKNKGEFYTIYTDQEFSWSADNQLIIDWDRENNLHIQLNNYPIKINTYETPRNLEITGNNSCVELTKVTFNE
jgi:hypothetical protein